MAAATADSEQGGVGTASGSQESLEPPANAVPADNTEISRTKAQALSLADQPGRAGDALALLSRLAGPQDAEHPDLACLRARCYMALDNRPMVRKQCGCDGISITGACIGKRCSLCVFWWQLDLRLGPRGRGEVLSIEPAA